MKKETIKSDTFSIKIQRESDIIHQFIIDINGDILNLKDFNLDINDLHLNTDKVRDFLIRNLEKVSKDPNFEELIWYTFIFLEILYHSIGRPILVSRNYDSAYRLYQLMLEEYYSLYNLVNNSLEILGRKKIDFNKVKWGVPLANTSICHFYLKRYEMSLLYMLAADYNDKFKDPGFFGLAEKIVSNSIIPEFLKYFYKIRTKLQEIYDSEPKLSYKINHSIFKDDNSLKEFLLKDNNFKYLIYTGVNIRNLEQWDHRFANSDFGYTFYYIFRIIINLTHIIEVWLKSLTGLDTSKLTEIRNKTQKYLSSKYTNSLKTLPLLKRNPKFMEFLEFLKNVYTLCFKTLGKLKIDTEIINYSITFIISLRNYSHHNFLEDVNLLMDLKVKQLLQLMNLLLIGLIPWLDAALSYKKCKKEISKGKKGIIPLNELFT